MAGGFPITQRWARPSTTNVTGSTGTFVTASATADTYGAWTELMSSTPSDANWAFVYVQDPSASALVFAVDVGLGASGSEVAVVSALQATLGTSGQGLATFLIPFPVPAGQRITARCQSTSAGSVSCAVAVVLFPAGFSSLAPGPIDTLGWSSAATLGVAIDPGASANVKGAYSELVTSTPVDYRGFFLAFDNGGSFSNTLCTWLYDLALGASGSEVVVLSNVALGKEAAGGFSLNNIPPIWFPIPAGQRIAVRAQSSTSAAAVRKFGVTFYGIR